MSAPQVLIVAGSDSSGGAGIVRDIETMAEIGVKVSVAMTAITVQTHDVVRAVEAVAPELVAAQMQAAFDANDIGAVKIGMLASAATVLSVAAVLRANAAIPVILDPVLASSSGRILLPCDSISSLQHVLLPQCDLVTPNLLELGILTGEGMAADEEAVLHQAALLQRFGGPGLAILAKGGHGHGPNAVDVLLSADGSIERFDAPRLPATVRGTGCMLASAIAAHVATGSTLSLAVPRAKAFVYRKLRAASGLWSKTAF